MTQMIKIKGIDIDGRAFPDYTWNADLVYYDGPFVSLYKRDNGPDALFFWIDSDNRNNRWAAVDLSRTDLDGYLRGNLSLRKILDNSIDCYIFNTGPKGRKSKITKLPTRNFPADYLPEQDSFLYTEIATNDAKKLATEVTCSYKLLLDGEDIYMDDLATIPKIYQQLYSFHYGLNNLDRPAIHNRLKHAMNDWTSGLSAVNLFSGLKNLIPSIHKARVSELKYASPGFVKLELIESIANDISSTMDSVVRNYDEAEKQYRSCYKYFNDQRISGFDAEDPEQRTPLTPLQTQKIIEFSNSFLRLINLQKYTIRFDYLEIQPIGRLRVLLAYFRRARLIKKYIDDGTLKVPQP